MDEFIARHLDQLRPLDTFRAFRNLWRINDEGEKELAQKLKSEPENGG